MSKKKRKSGRAVNYTLCFPLSELNDHQLYSPSCFAHMGVQSGRYDASQPKELFKRIRNCFFRHAKLFNLPSGGDGCVLLPSQSWEVAWFGSRWKLGYWAKFQCSHLTSKRPPRAGARKVSKRPGQRLKLYACIDHLEDEALYSPELLGQLTHESGLFQHLYINSGPFLERVRASYVRFMRRKKFPRQGDGWIMHEGQPSAIGWWGKRWKMAWAEHQGESIPANTPVASRVKKGRPLKYAACFTCLEADRLYSAACMAEIGMQLDIYKEPGGKLWQYRKMHFNFSRIARIHLPTQADTFIAFPHRGLEPAWFGQRWRDVADPQANTSAELSPSLDVEKSWALQGPQLDCPPSF